MELNGAMARQVVVIGAGVAGTAVAAELSATPGIEVTVLERGPAARLIGSTGYAPGLVGLLNEAPHLSELARTSAQIYEDLEHDGKRGFDRTGGMEIAGSAAALAEIERRAKLAESIGLPSRMLTPAEAAQAAPDLVDPARCRGALLFPADGTADARTITAALYALARTGGAHFRFDTTVTGIAIAGDRVRSVQAGEHEHPADDVVLATGIWGPTLAALAGQQLPLVPVAHPYVHTTPRAPATARSPFVRWPEQHVYGRGHGDRIGLGTYDHEPVPVLVEDLGSGAERPWTPVFDAAVERAIRLLPHPDRIEVGARLNGVFSMTADNQPLLGAFDAVAGLWAAEALWVTHAAGAARALAHLMTDSTRENDMANLDALRPDRFRGQAEDQLRREALRLYRDIYAAA